MSLEPDSKIISSRKKESANMSVKIRITVNFRIKKLFTVLNLKSKN